MAINDISSIFSRNTAAAKKKSEEIEANRPVPYKSNWSGTINNLMDKIVNQKDFSYDFNADPLYQQYKDQYTQLGKQAALDTQANAATLTGGFGNSYAATAATQANQQYLTQLNNVIPQLYSLAMDKYQMDTDKLYNQFSAVGNQEDREYDSIGIQSRTGRMIGAITITNIMIPLAMTSLSQIITRVKTSLIRIWHTIVKEMQYQIHSGRNSLIIVRAETMYRIRSGSSSLIIRNIEIMYQIHSGKNSMRCHLQSQKVPEEVHPEAKQVVQRKPEQV